MAILVSGVKCHHLTMKVTPIQLQLVRKMFSRPSVLSPSHPPVLQAAPQPSPRSFAVTSPSALGVKIPKILAATATLLQTTEGGKEGREAGTSRLLIRERTRPDSLMNQVGPAF